MTTKRLKLPTDKRRNPPTERYNARLGCMEPIVDDCALGDTHPEDSSGQPEEAAKKTTLQPYQDLSGKDSLAGRLDRTENTDSVDTKIVRLLSITASAACIVILCAVWYASGLTLKRGGDNIQETLIYILSLIFGVLFFGAMGWLIAYLIGMFVGLHLAVPTTTSPQQQLTSAYGQPAMGAQQSSAAGKPSCCAEGPVHGAPPSGTSTTGPQQSVAIFHHGLLGSNVGSLPAMFFRQCGHLELGEPSYNRPHFGLMHFWIAIAPPEPFDGLRESSGANCRCVTCLTSRGSRTQFGHR